MEKIKQNMAAKVTAFIVATVCVASALFGGIVVMYNVSQGWYSGDKNAEMAAYERTAEYVSNTAVEYMNELESYKLEEKEKTAEGEIEREVPNFKDFFYNERTITQMGYLLTPTDKQNQPIKLNENLKSEGYTQTFEHSNFKVEVYLGNMENKDGLPIDLYGAFHLSKMANQWKTIAIAIVIGGTLIAVFLMAFLFSSVGRKANDTMRMVPLDLLAVLCGMGILGVFATILNETRTIYMDSQDWWIAMTVMGSLLAAVIGVGYLTFFAARANQGKWWRSTIVFQGLRLIKRAVKKLVEFLGIIPIVWRAAVIVGAVILLNLILMPQVAYSAMAWLLWVLMGIVMGVCVIYIAWGMKKLKDGGEHLAKGDLGYQVDKKGLRWDLADHADSLNSIGKGMARAVEEKTKSERFKAELITNVSHDLKTPLTSIINYVDFLKKEELNNEKAEEYVQVLDRHAQRLKRLTEDLVEASKAATGNVKINLMPCQVGVLMTQTMGEYKEKAEDNGLTMIMKIPDEELEIMADGKRLWRVFDNLLNNICKYAQQGTRVYLNLEKKQNQAVITYRNTSKYELNISEGELMERFVRGDSSRHTEGSGLGLSIARNLVELQGGNFEIFIDGDLFKVVVTFDLIGL